MFDCLANADQHGLHMLLIKLDLQKAFDKVTIHQALHLMTLMGAPEGVVAVLRQFYGNLARVLTVEGHAHPTRLPMSTKGWCKDALSA